MMCRMLAEVQGCGLMLCIGARVTLRVGTKTRESKPWLAFRAPSECATDRSYCSTKRIVLGQFQCRAREETRVCFKYDPNNL